MFSSALCAGYACVLLFNNDAFTSPIGSYSLFGLLTFVYLRNNILPLLVYEWISVGV